MLDQLNDALKMLPELLTKVDIWKSLIIDRRKPITHRVFTMIGDNRLCLHRFEQFDETAEEAFFHPHPWPGAFKIIQGAYRMDVGHTDSRHDDFFENGGYISCTMELTKGSAYEIVEPLVWHRITPITPVVYTIMMNGTPWSKDEAHAKVRTTAGKDLKQMSPEQLKAHLDFFAEAIKVK